MTYIRSCTRQSYFSLSPLPWHDSVNTTSFRRLSEDIREDSQAPRPLSREVRGRREAAPRWVELLSQPLRGAAIQQHGPVAIVSYSVPRTREPRRMHCAIHSIPLFSKEPLMLKHKPPRWNEQKQYGA
ncbi:hypothetical protein RND71_035209 [Anisodus tanguticus]|uniref:Uncharacterized protein n=1 Tax=Anisodus tanguticus TaxID=243964 RepID=A0AAE1R558_9SOLA|nr:hypothetical protein RND71_035209 [Anisodus tanguticus]